MNKLLYMAGKLGYRDESFIGKRVGMLTVVGRIPHPNGGRDGFLCRCDCGKEVIRRYYLLSPINKSRRYNSCGCTSQHRGESGRSRMKPGLEAVERPTLLDIAWAAGIYEGEGSCSLYQVTVSQKDPWLCYRLRALFGGSVAVRTRQTLHDWHISGPRARGFLMTIWVFLSPRRKKQVNIDGWLSWSKAG